jgi:hypothetical protein
VRSKNNGIPKPALRTFGTIVLCLSVVTGIAAIGISKYAEASSFQWDDVQLHTALEPEISGIPPGTSTARRRQCEEIAKERFYYHTSDETRIGTCRDLIPDDMITPSSFLQNVPGPVRTSAQLLKDCEQNLAALQKDKNTDIDIACLEEKTGNPAWEKMQTQMMKIVQSSLD